MNQSPTAETEVNPGAKRKKLLWLWIVLAVLLLLTAAFFISLWKWLKPWQEVPSASLTGKDFKVQYKLMKKISKELSRKKIQKKAVLRLSPEEVNSIFKLGGNYKPRQLQVPVRYFQPTYHKGVFSLTYPVRLEALKLPNKAIYFHISFKVAKESGKALAVSLISIKANGLLMPDSVVKKAQAKLDAKMKKLQDDAARILDSISVKNDELILIYDPQTIMFLMMGKALR